MKLTPELKEIAQKVRNKVGFPIFEEDIFKFTEALLAALPKPESFNAWHQANAKYMEQKDIVPWCQQAWEDSRAALPKPEPVGATKELGKRLAALLDEDDWAYIEPFLNAVIPPISSTSEQPVQFPFILDKQTAKFVNREIKYEEKIKELEARIAELEALTEHLGVTPEEAKNGLRRYKEREARLAELEAQNAALPKPAPVAVLCPDGDLFHVGFLTPESEAKMEYLYTSPPVISELEAKFVLQQTLLEDYGVTHDEQQKKIKELEAQNAVLLVAIEAKNAAIVNANNRHPCPMYEEALALSPSAELLEARDRKRDAALLRAAKDQTELVTTDNELEELANMRESGEWRPELKGD